MKTRMEDGEWKMDRFVLVLDYRNPRTKDEDE
jgi:hypothetical protein